jgi:hypothetical protein
MEFSMGIFNFFSELAKNASKDKSKNNNWEEHCESCGELLEDCECDWQKHSREDISHNWLPKDENEMDLWDE